MQSRLDWNRWRHQVGRLGEGEEDLVEMGRQESSRASRIRNRISAGSNATYRDMLTAIGTIRLSSRAGRQGRREIPAWEKDPCREGSVDTNR